MKISQRIKSLIHRRPLTAEELEARAESEARLEEMEATRLDEAARLVGEKTGEGGRGPF
jgi:hypothetical protein